MSAGTMSVGLVGLGNMGQAFAERLLDAGYALTVVNRTPGREAALVERGAVWGGTDGSALAGVDVCLSSLADDDALETWSGALVSSLRPGTALVEMSTVSVAASRRLAEALDEAGIRYLRAPASGNPGAVRGGTAALVVSGDAGLAAEVAPLLTAIAPTVRNVGEGEAARVVKLVLQIFIGGTAELLAEALVLGESAGVERRALLDAVNASVVGSKFIAYKSEPLLRDDYAATFTTALMQKDVDLVLDLSEELGVELPLTVELRSLLEATARNGHADQDFMALLLELQERARTAPTHRER